MNDSPGGPHGPGPRSASSGGRPEAAGAPRSGEREAADVIGTDPLILLEDPSADAPLLLSGALGGSRALASQPSKALQALARHLLARQAPGTLRGYLTERLQARPSGSRAFQGKPDRMLRLLWQLLTDLFTSYEQAVGIRLLSDPRDTGRVRRFLYGSDPVTRAAALMSRFLPFAARRAFTGLSGASATDQERYGAATAWDLYYLARNPALKADELRALAARLDCDDPAFWPELPDSPGSALAHTVLAAYVRERWHSRRALRDAVLLRVIEHPACPADLASRVLRERDPGEIDQPRMGPVVERLMETTLGRSVLAQWHERYLAQYGAAAVDTIRRHHRQLLARSGMTQPELNLLFRIAHVDDVLDAVARTRGRLAQQAHETARALLVQLVAEDAPERLEEAWEAAKGSRMVAATMASLSLPRAKALASQQPELPAPFRRHLERWAVAHRETGDGVAGEILFNLGTIRYHDQSRPGAGA
jgi:hypothetical protein